MDEADLIDWYDVVEAVANGRLTGHRCPVCDSGDLDASAEGGRVRVVCRACGQGFSGQLGYGRDDAFYREAVEDERRRAQPPVDPLDAGPPLPPGRGAHRVAPPPPEAPRPVERPEPWTWSLPADAAGDADGFEAWADIVTAIYNGRRTGLNCPMCSEPLDDIEVREPYVRVACTVCGERFEGRLG